MAGGPRLQAAERRRICRSRDMPQKRPAAMRGGKPALPGRSRGVGRPAHEAARYTRRKPPCPKAPADSGPRMRGMPRGRPVSPPDARRPVLRQGTKHAPRGKVRGQEWRRRIQPAGHGPLRGERIAPGIKAAGGAEGGAAAAAWDPPHDVPINYARQRTLHGRRGKPGRRGGRGRPCPRQGQGSHKRARCRKAGSRIRPRDNLKDRPECAVRACHKEQAADAGPQSPAGSGPAQKASAVSLPPARVVPGWTAFSGQSRLL